MRWSIQKKIYCFQIECEREILDFWTRICLRFLSNGYFDVGWIYSLVTEILLRVNRLNINYLNKSKKSRYYFPSKKSTSKNKWEMQLRPAIFWQLLSKSTFILSLATKKLILFSSPSILMTWNGGKVFLRRSLVTHHCCKLFIAHAAVSVHVGLANHFVDFFTG